MYVHTAGLFDHFVQWIDYIVFVVFVTHSLIIRIDDSKFKRYREFTRINFVQY